MTSHCAIAFASSWSGEMGRATPNCCTVGKRIFPGSGNIAVSRGIVRYTGPRGSLIATCNKRLTISPGLSMCSKRWSVLVNWRTISA